MKWRAHRAWGVTAAVLGSVALVACSGDGVDEAADVSAVLESGDTASLAQALAAARGDPEAIAEHVARHALGALYPADCATRTRDRLRVHLQFRECTGPFGKRKLTGGIDFEL